MSVTYKVGCAFLAWGGFATSPATLLAQSRVRLERTAHVVSSEFGAIGGVADAAIADDGVIYVLDPDRPGIVAADQRLHYLKSFGRRGSGPGEYREPVAIRTLATNRIAVLDRSLRRITIYRSVRDSLLVLQRVIVLGIASESMCALPDGTFLIYGYDRGKRIHLVSSSGKILRSFGEQSARLSPMAGDLVTKGGVRCDSRGEQVVVTSKFLPQVEVFAIPSGQIVWSDSLRPFRSLILKDQGNTVSIAGGPAGSSLVTSLLLNGRYDVFQATFDGRMDKATVDTVTSYVRSNVENLWNTPQYDLPVLYPLRDGLALGVEVNDDVAISLYRVSYSPLSR